MSFSVVLDVALGLVLVYFLFSVAASKINEMVVSKMELRADGVEVGIRRLLHGGTEAATVAPDARVTADKLKNLELIKNESAPGKRPSYLRPRTFALAMLDLLAPPLHQLVGEMKDVATGGAGTGQVLAILNSADEDDSARVVTLRAALLPAGGGPPTFPVDSEMLNKLKPLLDEAAAHMANDSDDPLAQVRSAVDHLADDHPAKRPLLRFLKNAENNREKLLDELEGWYNGVMARVTGWYKRKVQLFILVYAIILTFAFNVDTLAIAGNLYRDSGSRQAVATAAINQSSAKTPDNVEAAIRSAKSLSVPIGWVLSQEKQTIHTYDGRHIPRHLGDWILKIVGLLVTIGALSFGAPFWFDALGKLANLRNSGQKAEAASGTATKEAAA
jgi:hypothetical protein